MFNRRLEQLYDLIKLSRQLETYNFVRCWLFCFWGWVVKEQRMTMKQQKNLSPILGVGWGRKSQSSLNL